MAQSPLSSREPSGSVARLAPRRAADDRAPGTVAPAEEARETQAPAAEAPARKGGASGGSRKRLILTAVAALALGLGVWQGASYWMTGRFMVETDDAYVGADMALMSPKISGYVAEVAVEANARVAAGQPLVRLDDGDARLAVEAADARIATQAASLARFDRQIAASDAQILQARAQQASAGADRARAASDYDRAQQLAKSSYGSRQTLDQAKADRDRTVAAVDAADAGVVAAEANRAVLEAQKGEAERQLGELRVARAQAQRDLDAAVIRAPFEGVVGNRSVQAGDYVTPGKRLLAVIPLDRVYVDANFKETQLGDIAVGQRVTLAVDAYPEHDAHGVVDSLAPASGAVFSLLPPENATGNFTKIVQRVPVRVRIDPDDVRKGRLRPGLSVVATVDIRTTPSTPELSASSPAKR